jgi:hypothetical protein
MSPPGREPADLGIAGLRDARAEGGRSSLHGWDKGAPARLLDG